MIAVVARIKVQVRTKRGVVEADFDVSPSDLLNCASEARGLDVHPAVVQAAHDLDEARADLRGAKRSGDLIGIEAAEQCHQEAHLDLAKALGLFHHLKVAP